MKTWDLALQLDRRSHLSLAQQLTRAITDAIRDGRLQPGAAVPSSRQLAQSLGLHRNTVVAAFDDLRLQGWVETVKGSHTRVTRALPEASFAPERRGAAVGFDLEPWPSSAPTFEAVSPRVLDFTGGLPDARLFDARALARAYRRALRRAPGRLLGFGSPAGDPVLRERLAQMLASRRGLAVTADDLIITRGSQLALHLLALAMVRRGDTVAVESPGYPSAREAFTLPGAKLLPIPVDAEGLEVDVLARKLERGSIRAAYVTPHQQDPTTVMLSARRRLSLLELARRHRFAIIEADYDYEFQFDTAPVLPMASADPHGVVVYVGTLSKALAPGLRMGFLVAPPPLRRAVLAVRGQVDRQGDLVLERAVAELLEDGEVLRHSLKARREFHARRDLLARLLAEHLGEVLDFEVPRGGLALWAKVARGVDVERWARQALEKGVRFFTGRPYSPSGARLPYLRLGFGHLDARELEEAVRRMKAALPR
ncbi:MAG: PLP-dependent aminotransferase family protein [Archangiaceae bacterium]|nr:PLP-dependent aminotransferase family protein [Archangiaceae bacterium]